MKHTDYNTVRELASGLIKEEIQMGNLIEELFNNLKALQGTFYDDSIDEIEYVIKSIADRYGNTMERVVVIAKNLREYANLLEEGK